MSHRLRFQHNSQRQLVSDVSIVTIFNQIILRSAAIDLPSAHQASVQKFALGEVQYFLRNVVHANEKNIFTSSSRGVSGLLTPPEKRMGLF